MGNSQPKLERHISTSLPSQLFPIKRDEDPSLVRKSIRGSKRKKHEQSYHAGRGPESYHRPIDVDVPLKNSLFLPQYEILTDAKQMPFQAIEVIAKGAFGNVLKVMKSSNNTIYAMKIMKKSQIIVEGAVQQVKDEATIQEAVGHHPFIVKPYWFLQNKDAVSIVMEYIPQGELFTAWKRISACDTFTEDLVRIYVAEMAMVLDYLHYSGIIYRDIKMENILIDGQGHIQIIDFGLAKWLKKGQRTTTICGTLQYIAPEILSLKPYGHTVDWWSLGILMYTLLAGHYPITGALNHTQMAQLVERHVYDLPNDLCFSYEARDCVRQLLKRDPDQRLHGLKALKTHGFFSSIDFDSLYKRQINPNYYLAAALGEFGPQKNLSQSCTSLNDSTFISGDLTCTWNESVASLEAMFV